MKIRTLVSILILVLTVLMISNCATTSKMLIQSADSGDYAEVKRLVEKGADVNTQNNYGRTALTVLTDHLDIDLNIVKKRNLNVEDYFATLIKTIKYLIHNGADVNIDKGAALRNAVRSSRPELVELFIKSGVNINQVGNPSSLLHDALSSSSTPVETIKILLKYYNFKINF